MRFLCGDRSRSNSWSNSLPGVLRLWLSLLRLPGLWLSRLQRHLIVLTRTLARLILRWVLLIRVLSHAASLGHVP